MNFSKLILPAIFSLGGFFGFISPVFCNPYGPGYYQKHNPYGDGYIQDHNPYGDGYVQDKSVFGY